MAPLVLLLLVLVGCLLALAIFRIVQSNRRSEKQARTIAALRLEINTADRTVEAQSEIIEQQAAELTSLRACFDDLTDVCASIIIGPRRPQSRGQVRH